MKKLRTLLIALICALCMVFGLAFTTGCGNKDNQGDGENNGNQGEQDGNDDDNDDDNDDLADLVVGKEATVVIPTDNDQQVTKTLYIEAGVYTLTISGEGAESVSVYEDGFDFALGYDFGINLYGTGATSCVFEVEETGTYTLVFGDPAYVGGQTIKVLIVEGAEYPTLGVGKDNAATESIGTMYSPTILSLKDVADGLYAITVDGGLLGGMATITVDVDGLETVLANNGDGTHSAKIKIDGNETISIYNDGWMPLDATITLEEADYDTSISVDGLAYVKVGKEGNEATLTLSGLDVGTKYNVYVSGVSELIYSTIYLKYGDKSVEFVSLRNNYVAEFTAEDGVDSLKIYIVSDTLENVDLKVSLEEGAGLFTVCIFDNDNLAANVDVTVDVYAAVDGEKSGEVLKSYTVTIPASGEYYLNVHLNDGDYYIEISGTLPEGVQFEYSHLVYEAEEGGNPYFNVIEKPDLFVGVEATVEIPTDNDQQVTKTLYIEAGVYTLTISGEGVDTVSVYEDGFDYALGYNFGITPGATSCIFEVSETGIYTLVFGDSAYVGGQTINVLIVEGAEYPALGVGEGNAANVAIGNMYSPTRLSLDDVADGLYTITVNGGRLGGNVSVVVEIDGTQVSLTNNLDGTHSAKISIKGLEIISVYCDGSQRLEEAIVTLEEADYDTSISIDGKAYVKAGKAGHEATLTVSGLEAGKSYSVSVPADTALMYASVYLKYGDNSPVQFFAFITNYVAEFTAEDGVDSLKIYIESDALEDFDLLVTLSEAGEEPLFTLGLYSNNLADGVDFTVNVYAAVNGEKSGDVVETYSGKFNGDQWIDFVLEDGDYYIEIVASLPGGTHFEIGADDGYSVVESSHCIYTSGGVAPYFSVARDAL